MTLATHAVVRVAGLPPRALRPLALPRTLSAIRELEELDRDLGRDRDPLCDALHALVRGLQDHDLRTALIELKRSVFNYRPFSWPPACERLGRLIERDSSLAARLSQWQARIERRGELEQQAGKHLDHEAAESLAALRIAWASSPFLTGVLLAQPNLLPKLLALLRAPASLDAKRSRHVQLSALAYWVRMATKTSPFSTFTATGLSFWGSEAAEASAAEPELRMSAFRVSAAILDRIAALASVHPAIARSLPLKTSPAVARQGGGPLLLLRRIRDPSGPIVPARVDERFTEVAPTDALLRAMALAEEGRDRDELILDLSREWPARDPKALEHFIQRLVSAGILERGLDFDANRPDGLSRLAGSFRARGNDLGARIADLLDAVELNVHALESLDPAGQGEMLRSIVDQCSRALIALDHEGLQELQGVVFQDCYVSSTESPLTPEELTSFDSELDRISAVMPLFNGSRALERLAVDFFRKRWGPGRAVPFNLFLREFYSERYEPVAARVSAGDWDPFKSELPEDQFPELGEMARERAALADAIASETRAAGKGPVALDPELLLRFAGVARKYWPPSLPLSVGYYVQKLDAARGLSRLVLNQIVPGYGTYLARSCNPRVPRGPDLARSVAEHLARWSPRGEWAEVVATFGFDGQVHLPLTPRCIPYPGEAVDAAARRIIRWGALHVELDEPEDRLSLRDGRAGRRILPLTVGSLSPSLLPLGHRVLASLGTGFLPDFSLLDLLDRRQEATPNGPLRHYPRISAGRLVLLRETWRVSGSSLPVAGRGSEIEHFRSLRAWARDRGLPAASYVVPLRMADWVRGTVVRARLRRVYKPFFVDFDSPLSLRLFDRYAAHPEATLTFSEALPSPLDPSPGSSGEQSVTELLLETWGAVHP